MLSSVRKEKIMDATMKIVADKGLETFAMIQVSKKAHINEALIYRDFGTKENLLFECYNAVAKQVSDLYSNPSTIDLSSKESILKAMHDAWMAYFTFLVKNDYKTIYYQSYRDSVHMYTYLQKEKEGEAADFDGFKSMMKPIIGLVELPQGMNMDYIWTFIMDTSSIFAKRIIRKELPDTKESYENIWNLLFSGLRSLL